MKCAWCGEPICERYAIDLREFGLGCFHKSCTRKDDAVLELALELLVEGYKRSPSAIESEEAYDEMIGGMDDA